jgi:hypothetical protein
LRLPLWNDDAAFQQDCAQLVDQSGSFTHQPFARSVERLHIELIFSFQLNETHRWTCRRLGDSFGITIVVLLCFDIRPDIFR